MNYSEDDKIVVVSGLPRSGTSLMMKMLDRGGISPITDDERKADDDNVGGYYEYEPVKKLKEDNSWLFKARGKSVKIISFFLPLLSDDYKYKIIFMRRDMDEILASQARMLVRRGESSKGPGDKEMKEIYQNHIEDVNEWLSNQNHIESIEISYNETVFNPDRFANMVNTFIGGNLNEKAMSKVIDKKQYRQRKKDKI